MSERKWGEWDSWGFGVRLKNVEPHLGRAGCSGGTLGKKRRDKGEEFGRYRGQRSENRQKNKSRGVETEKIKHALKGGKKNGTQVMGGAG